MADKLNQTQIGLFWFLKAESAMPVILFYHHLPIPFGAVVFLVCVTTLLAEVSEDRARGFEKRSKQFAALISWGAVNSIVCFLGILMHTWWERDGELPDFMATFKVILFYTALILVCRSIGFIPGLLFEAKKPGQ